MNNHEVEKLLDDCWVDLNQAQTIIVGIGSYSNVVPYLTKYAIIKACGTIETSFKMLVADYCEKRSKKQVKKFLESRVRENPCNPNLDNICKILKDFDDNWNNNFKQRLNLNVDSVQLKTSLKSIVDARNEFAHGGNPASSFSNVIQYYTDCRKIIEILDSVII